jgi:hypothetical protein
MGQIRRRVRGGVLGAARRLPPPRDEAAVSVLRSVNSLVRGRVPEAAVPIRPGPEQASLQDLLDSAFASGDQARIGKAVKQLHALQIHAERLASPLSSEKGRLAETKGVKSIQYMIDLLPHIQQVIGQHPLHTTFEILDVGPPARVTGPLCSRNCTAAPPLATPRASRPWTSTICTPATLRRLRRTSGSSGRTSSTTTRPTTSSSAAT